MKNHYVKSRRGGRQRRRAWKHERGGTDYWDEFLDVLAVVVALSFLLVSCVIFS